MRVLKYMILIIFISCNSTKNTGTVTILGRPIKPIVYNDTFVFRSNSEIGVTGYQIQRSPTKTRWTTIVPVTPKFQKDSNWYAVPLPPVNSSYYYRLVSTLDIPLPKNKRKTITYTKDPVYIKVSK